MGHLRYRGGVLVWTLLRRGETAIGALLPWFSAHRRQALWLDLHAHWVELQQLRLKHAESESALASAAHGLGLLAVSAMAATGTAMALSGVASGVLLASHKAIATPVWIYVLAHAGMALLHQSLGHDVLRRMFQPQLR